MPSATRRDVHHIHWSVKAVQGGQCSHIGKSQTFAERSGRGCVQSSHCKRKPKICVIRHGRTFETMKMCQTAPKFGRRPKVTTVAVWTRALASTFLRPSNRSLQGIFPPWRDVTFSRRPPYGVHPREAMTVLPLLAPWQPTVSAAAVEYSEDPIQEWHHASQIPAIGLEIEQSRHVATNGQHPEV